MTGMKPVNSMTPCDVQASGAIELWFYGELDPDERHGSSPSCRVRGVP